MSGKKEIEEIQKLMQRMKGVFKGVGVGVAICFFATLLIDYGFTLTPDETLIIHKIYGFAWFYYLCSFTLRVIFQRKQIRKKSITMTILMGGLMYLSALPKLFHTPEGYAVWVGVWDFLSNTYFISSLLFLFSVVEVSRGVVNFINKKTNPALLLTVGFAIIIGIGTILLLLPRSTTVSISITDALFVATSAVCVTGLTPVDVATAFTTEGQIVLALLVQIGGLGVMTITSFFALFFMGGTGLYNQFALRDMVSSDTFSSLVTTLLYIIGFTFMIELCGALLIWMSIHATLGLTLHEELFFSVFHAVSAFCNAGFSTLTGNLGNETIISEHNMFYLVISALIVLGGIGFPILVNFKEIIFYHVRMGYHKLFRKKSKPTRYIHLTNINTKIVLITTLALIVGGTVLFALFEWNASFSGMSTLDKITHALFNSVSTRTAGFSSIDLTQFSILSIVIYLFLMWIGGAAQSTAGGIKVNTFAVVMANFLSVIRGSDRVDLFGREIPSESIRRAGAVLFGSILAIVVFVFILITMEPSIPPLHLLFETISALSTVGSSLNTTPLLSNESKVLVAIIMFVGRVGLITILMSFISSKPKNRFRYPQDRVIIN